MTSTPDRSARAEGARRRWAATPPAERIAATERARAARKQGAQRSRAARELLSAAEAALVAAGARIEWPGGAR